MENLLAHEPTARIVLSRPPDEMTVSTYILLAALLGSAVCGAFSREGKAYE